MTQQIHLNAQIPAAAAGRRLDQVLAELFPDYSRSRLQQWVRAGEVRLDGEVVAARYKVFGGERVQISAELALDGEVEPEAIALEVRYRDEHLLVVDKPAGLVVHPAAGNPRGTLQNALLHYEPRLAALPRAGIVHRLDKDTSGLMVVACSLPAHQSLVAQLQARTVQRQYQALALGEVTAGGRVDAPIGRHPRDRLRMAVVAGGKPAVTHYRVLERLPGCTLLLARLETGRTHQIRVHLASIRHPLVGDPLYGGRARLPRALPEPQRVALAGFARQALHAWRLELEHPASGETLAWEAGLPEDFSHLLTQLRSP